MDNVKYAAIGSRETPENVLKTVVSITKNLAERGFLMRSGGAVGFDQFAEIGCNLGNGLKEIFLPSKNFNNNKSNFFMVSEDAKELAKKFHPAWNRLGAYAKLLIARNGYQILGQDLNDPVNFVLCWTKNGKDVGGTAQGLRIARYYNIPIINLGEKYLTEEEIINKVKKII